MGTKPTLLFVYNADSTIFAVASDIVKKIIAPQTQECNLCKITYGALTPKEEWSNFLSSLPQEKTFLHRDEFASQYPNKKSVALPAVFVERAGALSELITAEEMKKTKTIADIATLVIRKTQEAKL